MIRTIFFRTCMVIVSLGITLSEPHACLQPDWRAGMAYASGVILTYALFGPIRRYRI